jgi:uncharacterized protein (TIGR00725 family)
MTVTVFGSSRCTEEEYAVAYDLGKKLATAGFSLCNGGFGGTMEATARGAKEAGGSTVGVTIALFGQSANRWIDRTVHTGTLTERLSKLIELGDAYVTLRGATGTLLELAAVWEMTNKGIIPKKPLLTLGTFWTPLIDLISREPSAGQAGQVVREVLSADECVRTLQRLLHTH